MPVTLKEEVEKYARSKGIFDLQHIPEHKRIVITAYFAGSSGVFGYALMCTAKCGAQKELPKESRRIFRNVGHIVKRLGRHLPDEMKEEFFGLVGKLKDGEQIPPEKADVVAGVVRNYLNDYLYGLP